MFTAQQLKDVRAAMTWGDQIHGRKLAKGDDQLMVAHAFHRRAKVLELVPDSTSFDDFLDMVTFEDLNAALDTEERNPTSPDTGT
jgi:hypothetical protein